MPKRETAVEREARYAEEVQAALSKFEAEKPVRLLRVLARAQTHGLATYFSYDDAIDNASIKIIGHDYEVYLESDYYGLDEYKFSNIEYELNELDSELKEKQRQAELKKVAMSKLTKEEQQLLGLI
jgi:hypothetical protein